MRNVTTYSHSLAGKIDGSSIKTPLISVIEQARILGMKRSVTTFQKNTQSDFPYCCELHCSDVITHLTFISM